MPFDNDSTISQIVARCASRASCAIKLHGAFASCHEGYAVILEELDELWDEVKKKKCDRDPQRIREESIDIAAAAIKLAIQAQMEHEGK